MHSRRYDDYGSESRSRDRGAKVGADFYLDRSPRLRRSLSPFRVEGSRVMGGGNRVSGSLERREYMRDPRGERGERLQKTSPSHGHIQKRYDNELVSGKDEWQPRNPFLEYGNTDATMGLKHQHGYGSATATPGVTRRQEFEGAGYRVFGPKTVGLEESDNRGLYILPADFGSSHRYTDVGSSHIYADVGSSHRYGDGDGNFASSSKNIDFDWLKDEKVFHPDTLPSRVSTMEPSANISHSVMPSSLSREVVDLYQLKYPVNPSFETSRTNFARLSRDDMSMPMDEYPRSSTTFLRPVESGEYEQRNILDSRTAPQSEHWSLTCSQKDNVSPNMTEHRDYMFPPRDSDFGYTPDKLRRRMTLHEEVESDHRDALRPATKEPIREYINDTEHHLSNLQNYSLRGKFSLQGGGRLDSDGDYFELGRKAKREQELPESSDMSNLQHRDYSYTRSDHGFGRDLVPLSYEEQKRRSHESQYEVKMHRFSERTQRISAKDVDIYESDRELKRKRIHDENNELYSKRMKGESNNYSGRQDSYSRCDERINLNYDIDVYRKEDWTFNDEDHHYDSASEYWFSSRDLMENVQKHSLQRYKPGSKYMKGNSKPHSFSHHDSHYSSRKHGFPKQRNVWIRGLDDKKGVHTNEAKKSQQYMNSTKAEPPEYSEELNKLVGGFFLSFTKMLHSNPVALQRYKEQGRAGSLFCIVCGRSQSKEFMNTESLARHAFMSHKAGLRAQHLGLHRAISVLMGWNTVIPPDVVTWFPEAISSAEALAQKEDLILWPPVIVIHNSTISGNSSRAHDFITEEALLEFLRSKGISSGRIKACLGKPSSYSTMVVKFLGTFSGLQHAEKLHKYFSENRHGRTDFEKISRSKGRISNSLGELWADKIESVLYGYMGVAEDLDKVDSDTKKKCVIKSKKEIQDFVDAPVKPE